jgi:hypothetical protein
MNYPERIKELAEEAERDGELVIACCLYSVAGFAFEGREDELMVILGPLSKKAVTRIRSGIQMDD